MKLVKVKILRPFYCSLPGGNGRDLRAGDEAEVLESLFGALSGEGYIEALVVGAAPLKLEEQKAPEAEPVAAPVKPAAPVAQPTHHPKAAQRTPQPIAPSHRNK